MNNKKIVVFGGGTGLSTLLRGLKKFPVDITAVITVSDNGRSTGKLRKEFNIPAVGDIRQVITSLSEIDPTIKDMMSYRFKTYSDLDGHAVGNLILTALLEQTGSLSEAIKALSTLLDVKATVLPISEDNLTLMAEDDKGNVIEGEEEIAEAHMKIKKIFYKENPTVSKEVIKAVNEADLVVLSMGSLYTSLLPNVICKDVQLAIADSNAKIIYACNVVTQPGETDNYTVSDHIKAINKHLKETKVDAVIASNSKMNKKIVEKYSKLEGKEPVVIDYKELEKLGVELIEDDLIILEDDYLRHDSLRLSFLIYSYLMKR